MRSNKLFAHQLMEIYIQTFMGDNPDKYYNAYCVTKTKQEKGNG